MIKRSTKHENVSVSLLFTLGSCGSSKSSGSADTAASESGTTLKNTMTETEKERTAFRDITLLDSEEAAKYGDNLDKWTFLPYDIERLRDNIRELKIYDEELDTDFLVHITLPPSYDENNTYPVFFLSDAVWWLGEVPAMWDKIQSGEAEPLIFVTLGYEYNTDATSDDTRVDKFMINQDKLLDFITDDLMPYISEQYHIDCADSTFFGHSCGGIFSHYALMMSDTYENQPFGRYIIGSPVFWAYYMIHDQDPSAVKDPDLHLSDFGYFDRNDTLDKKVFLYAGSLEDGDYEEVFNGHPSTTEGLDMLCDRLTERNADVTLKLYPTRHYQYLHNMFRDYILEQYPAEEQS